MRVFLRFVAMRSLIVLLGLLAFTVFSRPVAAQSPDQVRRAMHRAVRFFREQASTQGGYVYQWSADLAKREGEGKVDETTVWIQPPGTPAVGMAFLNAYRACGDPMLLEAAKETADASQPPSSDGATKKADSDDADASGFEGLFSVGLR